MAHESSKKSDSQTQQVHGEDIEPMEGFMNKMGEMVKSWKYRFFKVVDGDLLYFEHKEDVKPKGSIPLAGAKLTYFETKTFQRANCFGVQPAGKERVYVIEANSPQERYQWLRYLFVNGASISAQSWAVLLMNSPELRKPQDKSSLSQRSSVSSTRPPSTTSAPSDHS